MKQIKNVFIGRNIITNDILSEHFHGSKIHIITDDNVKSLHLDVLVNKLINFDVTYTSLIPAESEKNIVNVIKIYEKLAKLNFNRNDILIALGGGVIGDITGFIASTYLRGIRFCSIPTSLLAQVDSSIGGKCGIDFSGGKNMIGSFYDAYLTLIDTSFLETLPTQKFNDGMAEVIKYGVSLDKTILDKILRDKIDIDDIVFSCVSLKLSIVNKDFLDKGIRQILNFGHTIGHAIESKDNYTALTHGKAVAIGMVVACDISYKLGFCDENYSEYLSSILRKFSLPTSFDLSNTYNTIKMDKKIYEDYINFIAIEKIGYAAIKKISLSQLENIII